MQNSTILERILAHKVEEVARQRVKVPLDALEERMSRVAAPRDFAAALRRAPRTALIAEVKRASPSRGVLIDPFDHMAIARAYRDAGAAAMSILTDVRFFQGSLKYLEAISQLEGGPPVLRKDFILDPYQVYEARAYGADAVLLIVGALDEPRLRELLTLTESLGMTALVEVHTEAQMECALAVNARVIGVNNRDLHHFTTDLTTTERLAHLLPTGSDRPVLVSESGIFTPEHVAQVRAYGADAILVGEALVTAPQIEVVARTLVEA
ncbi:MAG: indole-3-glycerol phosphate synthase TrpC [Oscillochloridaceae bacterium umkhey_bin13]